MFYQPCRAINQFLHDGFDAPALGAVAHRGIWNRHEPWAPAVLEPLIEGLKARGMCFATLRDHPQYGMAANTPK